MEKSDFYELVYADKSVESLILSKFPNTVIKNASDFVHTERFEVEIPEITEDEFYPFAIKEGFVKCCLGFEIILQSLAFPEPNLAFGKYERGQNEVLLTHKETKEKIEKWIKIAKELL